MPIPFRFAPIPLALLYDPDVPGDALRLWATIYRMADVRSGSGPLAVDRETIAARLGWSEKTLSKWTKVLSAAGYLEVTRRGQGKPNLYRPLCPDPPDLESPDRSLLDGTGRSLPSSTSEISNTERTTPDASGAGPKADPDAWLKEWWEQQDPRPTQSFVAIRGVGRAALRSGWDVPTLQRAMTEIPSISTAALDFWRSRQNGSARPSLRNAPGSPLAQGATDRTGVSGDW